MLFKIYSKLLTNSLVENLTLVYLMMVPLLVECPYFLFLEEHPKNKRKLEVEVKTNFVTCFKICANKLLKNLGV